MRVDRPVALVVLEGKREKITEVEDMVRRVRHAAILDSLARSRLVPRIGKRLIYTNDQGLASSVQAPFWEVDMFPSCSDFHFGLHFTSCINRHNLRKVFYMGGGSAPLLTEEEMRKICEGLTVGENIFYANNFFSSDFVGFTPGSAINRICAPKVDNLLAYLLKEEGQLKQVPLPPSMGTMLDIDTPVDLMILSLCPALGEKASAAIRSLNLPLSNLLRILPLLRDKEAEVLIFGRISSLVFAHLDAHVKCRLRIISEERGMKARGRLERGEVLSLFGYYLEDLGPKKFFERIARVCHGAFIDSRVLFAHLKKRVSVPDRFFSDLGQADMIKDPFVREFTRAAWYAPVPVVLGGHSLISGGLWVMGELIEHELTGDANPDRI